MCYTFLVRNTTQSYRFPALLLGATLIFLFSSSLAAQTDNYWSWNFNTHSTLLSGAVVAGGAGPSAIFYNPALIDQENMSSLSLSANMVSFQFYRVKNQAGPGIDSSAENFKIQPRFISYVLPIKSDKIGLQVAILSPISEEMSFSIDHRDVLDVIDRTLGDENYTGYLKYSLKYSDTWVGIGLSYKPTSQFSLGGSLFVSNKLFEYAYIQQMTAYQDGDTVDVGTGTEDRYIATSGQKEELDYWYVSMIGKLGVTYRSPNNRVNLGLNFTFPAIPLFGSADTREEYYRTNVYDNEAGSFTSNENSIEVDEGNTNIRIKNPFSVALGLRIISKSQNTALSLTGEYFHKLDPYQIVESTIQPDWVPGYVAQGVETGNHLDFQTQADPVINGGIGIKQRISKLVTYMGGFRTDFSANRNNRDLAMVQPNRIKKGSIDKYHFTSGVSFKIKRLNIVTGVQYTMGRQSNQMQPVNFATPQEYIPTTDQSLDGIRQKNAHTQVDEVAFFFGMEIDLEKKSEPPKE